MESDVDERFILAATSAHRPLAISHRTLFGTSAQPHHFDFAQTSVVSVTTEQKWHTRRVSGGYAMAHTARHPDRAGGNSIKPQHPQQCRPSRTCPDETAAARPDLPAGAA
jgi:hypothetical protein